MKTQDYVKSLILLVLILALVYYLVPTNMVGGGSDEEVVEVIESPDAEVSAPPVMEETSSEAGDAEPMTFEEADQVVADGVAEQGMALHEQVETIRGVDSGLTELNQEVLPRPLDSSSPTEASDVCGPADQLTSDELLPAGENGWGDAAPETQGSLSYMSFVESTQHHGINTVGNSLRNANRQLRSDPIIPRKEVGPWGQSTLTGEMNRKQLEIGSGM